MKISAKSLVPLLICLVVCFVSNSSAVEQGKDVIVANPANQPVPITGTVGMTGIANVNVANPVTSPVPIAGDVGITGTANVNITNTVPVTFSGPSQQPFQITLSCLDGGDEYGCHVYHAPQDARLVIEQVSVLFMPTDTSFQVITLGVETTLSGTRADHWIEPPAVKVYMDGIHVVQSGSQLTRIYADAGSVVVPKVGCGSGRCMGTGDGSRLKITLSGQQVVDNP